jgi:gamma-glutamyl:cysteine ligase YbdK (ATP-grasp superfamily)
VIQRGAMSEIQEIDVFVRPDGTVTVEVRGVEGKKCLTLTERVEALLGGTIIERIHRDDFHQAEEEQSQEDLSIQRR